MSCQIVIPDVEGIEKVLTVGRVFNLDCETSAPPKFKEGAALEFKLDEKQKYVLKYLGLVQEKNAAGAPSSKIQIEATSYRVGKQKLDDVILTDGTEELHLGPLEFELHSVIDPQQAPPEPYGPIGPVTLPFPYAYFGPPFAILVILFVFGLRMYLRRRHKRLLLERMREYEGALPPLSEYHQKMRALRREKGLDTDKELPHEENIAVLRDVDRAFRIFLIRRFRWPALDWSEGALFSEFKRERRKLYDETAVDLRKLLREFAAGLRAPKLVSKDVLKILEESRRVADKLDARDVALSRDGRKP